MSQASRASRRALVAAAGPRRGGHRHHPAPVRPLPPPSAPALSSSARPTSTAARRTRPTPTSTSSCSTRPGPRSARRPVLQYRAPGQLRRFHDDGAADGLGPGRRVLHAAGRQQRLERGSGSGRRPDIVVQPGRRGRHDHARERHDGRRPRPAERRRQARLGTSNSRRGPPRPATASPPASSATPPAPTPTSTAPTSRPAPRPGRRQRRWHLADGIGRRDHRADPGHRVDVPLTNQQVVTRASSPRPTRPAASTASTSRPGALAAAPRRDARRLRRGLRVRLDLRGPGRRRRLGPGQGHGQRVRRADRDRLAHRHRARGPAAAGPAARDERAAAATARPTRGSSPHRGLHRHRHLLDQPVRRDRASPQATTR